MVQWLGLCTFTAEGPGSIPGHTSYALWHGTKKQRPRNGNEHAASGELQEFLYYSFTCLALRVMVNVRWGVER